MTATGTLLVKHRSSTSTVKTSLHNHFSLKRHRRQASATVTIRRCPSLVLVAGLTMSKALIRELDLKMQQVKEYGLIAHGYHNENLRYPVHVRRSHDGEKVPRTPLVLSHLDSPLTCPTTAHTVLAPSSHENTRKSQHPSARSRTDRSLFDERQTALIVPPNKTVRDIEPLHSDDFPYSTTSPLTRLKSTSHYYQRKTPTSADSSPLSCSIRPHSIACITSSTPLTTDSNDNTKILLRKETTSDCLSNSSQSLVSQSTSSSNSSRTITQRLSQKFFSKLFHHHSPPKS